MGIVLKTRDGRQIIQTISHPATDEQVRAAISNYFDENGIAVGYDTSDIRANVFGEGEFSAPEVTWEIGQVNDSTGAITTDSQSMRIVSNLISCPVELEIRFTNTTAYYYQYYLYDKNGEYIKYSPSWQTAASLLVEKDYQVIIKVREKNYKTWTDATIQDFATTAIFEYKPNIGVVAKVAALEGQIARIPSVENAVSQNAAAIKGLQDTMNNSDGGNTNVLLQYEDHCFDILENGEISWQTGLDVGGASDQYVRSRDYKLVTDTGCVFIAKIPDGAQHSWYCYSHNGDDYVFESVSDWMPPSTPYKPTPGMYHRVLIYKPAGVMPDEVNIILAGEAVGNLLDNVAQQYGATGGGLYDYDLSQADVLEMNTTAAAINNFSDANTACIAFLTDLHIPCYESEDQLKGAKPRLNKQIAMYNRLCTVCPIDLAVYGGDYLANNPTTEKSAALAAMQYIGKLIGQTDASVPRIVMRGNHDDNTMHTDYVNGFLSFSDFYDAVGKVDMAKSRRDVDNIDHFYGYYDIPNKKIRVFALNTVDVPSVLDEETNSINYRGQWDTGFSQAQLQFVADNLIFSEPGWQVIFFSHHALINTKQTFEPGSAEAVGVDSTHGGDSMLEIITAFKNGSSGHTSCATKDFESEVDYDFTTNKSNTVIALVNGHTHRYGMTDINGMNAISTRAVDGHATYAASHGLTCSGIYLVIDRKQKVLHYISNDIADEQGNQPTSNDYDIPYN